MQDKAEADRSGLRIVKEMVWDAERWKQEATEGSFRTESDESGAGAAFVYGGNTQYVPFLWKAWIILFLFGPFHWWYHDIINMEWRGIPQQPYGGSSYSYLGIFICIFSL